MKQNHKLFFDIAERIAQESHSRRLKVGSILVKDGQIISIGYNGTAPGRDNNCEYEVDGKLVTKPEVIHGEMNVLRKCVVSGISTVDATLYNTIAPCIDCSKFLVGLGLKEILYLHDFRDMSGVEFLKECGENISKWSE